MAGSSLEGEETGSITAEDSRSTKSGSGRSRPSFTDYWKRTKQAARRITFVSSNPEQSTGPTRKTDSNQEEDNDDGQEGHQSQSAQAKALARRQQVRKAQKQHRQRKVNYTNQLEMDVAKLRDLIEHTERESLAIRNENETIRRRLLRNTAPAPAAQVGLMPLALTYGSSISSLPEYTVSLINSSEALDKPMFQVQRVSAQSSSWSSLGGFANEQTASGAAGGFEDAAGIRGRRLLITQTETDQAINFILELERICWNHFHPSMYNHNDYDPEAREHGHSLMVSTMALRSAPPEAWAQISAEEARQASLPSHSHSHSAPPPSLPLDTHTHTHTHSSSSHASPHPHPHPNPHPHTHPHSLTNVITSWPTPTPTSPSTSTSTAALLTLENLRGLAAALNPNPEESAELAPVQAWFEIARLYGGIAALLRDAPRLERLRVEMAAVVDCIHYGAVIRRADFESTLERVMGPPVVGGGAGAVPAG
ncbi:hypothetical protein F5Y00DRAFT_227278 [Daldinia vernicosa]|uniref:uncharacterized protein n=1 Tax=Daldinia vernicosa TaxID=114800 RepID=UPI002007D78A|nr:uncharacterized protein F5Y00DRAFT_227278 [Daldinia vernicosa]KAI0852669.1 hypothetical protein F5Y00DRAFT_227278 [Daldinia vernicosa]